MGDLAMQKESAQFAELSWKDARIRYLEAQLDSQADLHRQTEQRLSNRCRLLQAWGFRIWWALDAGGSSAPGIISKDATMSDALQPSLLDTPLPLKTPLPNEWRSILGFQASLFQWLAAETVRLKDAKLKGREEEVEQLLSQAEAQTCTLAV